MQEYLSWGGEDVSTAWEQTLGGGVTLKGLKLEHKKKKGTPGRCDKKCSKKKLFVVKRDGFQT